MTTLGEDGIEYFSIVIDGLMLYLIEITKDLKNY